MFQFTFCVNSLASERFEWKIWIGNFKLILVIEGWGILLKSLWNCPQMNDTGHLTNDKSTLVQLMAWYHQATFITWANGDPNLCYHIMALGHNEFMICNACPCKKLLLGHEWKLCNFPFLVMISQLHCLVFLPVYAFCPWISQAILFDFISSELTRSPLVLHTCISVLGHH